MNREIKFRAWHTKLNTMFHNIQNTYDGLVDSGVDQMLVYETGNTASFDSWLTDADSVVMQYTGLKDKNGGEIYEGDIVQLVGRLKKTYLGVMRWDNDNACYYFDRLGNYDEEFGTGVTKEAEIIGNIYQTPELLKETKRHRITGDKMTNPDNFLHEQALREYVKRHIIDICYEVDVLGEIPINSIDKHMPDIETLLQSARKSGAREGIDVFVTTYLGKRCKDDYEEDCLVCQMWEHRDEYLAKLEGE